MPLETESVTGNPDAPQQNPEETQKELVSDDNDSQPASQQNPEQETRKEEQLVQVSDNDSQPSVQEGVLKSETVEEAACPIKPSIKSPVAEATEDFLVNEKNCYVEVVAPSTPANSDADVEESATEPEPPQIVDYNEKETVAEAIEEPVIELNGHHVEESTPLEESAPSVEESAPAPVEPEPEVKLSNGNKEEFNGECKFEPKIVAVVPEIENGHEKPALNGTIASELPDYKLPDVVEVKKNFEFIAPAGHNLGHVPPKKGALSTTIDSQGVRQAYQDVRNDGSETQWAIFKFEGPTILTSATGADFDDFKGHFGEDERAFAYIRVQTGDEMSRRAKFLFFTWVGPNVSVLKRAKMSTDKALIKDIVSNFAVELQTENPTDITLHNFETELDKAAGAHYGTGIRS